MIASSILLSLASFGSLDLPALPVANEEIVLELAQGVVHKGKLQSFLTNDTGTYLTVGGKVYRLPTGTEVPPAGTVIKIHGVTTSPTGDAHYRATSVSW
jgi:hypothetical protein